MKVRIAFVILAGLWAVSLSQSSLRAQAPKTVNDGVFTAEQSKRGADTYAANCASCHGGDLAGDGFAPALAGSDFASNWNDLSVGDLFERMRISMPPNDPSKVPPQGKADILAFVLDQNRYPAGKVELEAKTEVLKQIKIEMKK